MTAAGGDSSSYSSCAQDLSSTQRSRRAHLVAAPAALPSTHPPHRPVAYFSARAQAPGKTHPLQQLAKWLAPIWLSAAGAGDLLGKRCRFDRP